MNCQEALNHLQEILDKEASEIDEQQVREHLKKCSECFDKFRIQESVQAFLSEKIKAANSDTAPSIKIENMRSDLLAKLDAIDEEQSKNKRGGFFSGPTKIILATAALIVLAGMAFVSASFFRHQEYYIPLEQAHWSVTDNPSEFVSTATAQEITNEIFEEYQFAINQVSEGYSLLGKNHQRVMDVEWDHVVFENDKDYISVFITSDENFVIPEDLEKSKEIVGNFEIYDHNCRGCRLIFYKNGSLVIITASTSNKIDLGDFNPGAPQAI